MGFQSLFSGPLSMLRGIAGDPIVYARGGESVEIVATCGKSRHDVTGTDGLVTIVTAQDFLFAASDLVLDGSATLPLVGDLVSQVIDGVEYVYQVLDLGGEQCYYFSDPGNTQIRVHTLRYEVNR